jgi:hypothetical protein
LMLQCNNLKAQYLGVLLKNTTSTFKGAAPTGWRLSGRGPTRDTA